MALGAPAAKKLKSFDALVEQAAWPAKVKLDFRRVADQHSTTEAPDGQATTAVWFPADEPVSTLIKRVQPRTHDFSLTYRDADGELVLLPPTTSGVRDFASVEGQGKRLTVEWRAPPVRPRQWTIPDEVEDARQEVERAGGIVMADNHHSSLVHCSDCEESKWPEVCGRLAGALELGGEEKEALLAIAGTCGGGRVFKSKDQIDAARSIITTRTLAYETTRGEGKITVACGIQVLSMKHQGGESLEKGADSVPAATCVQLGARVFSVIPQATPGPGNDTESDVSRWYDIPEGWEIVDASGNDFAEVLQVVIRGHAWGFKRTSAIFVWKEGQWPGYYGGAHKQAGNVWQADSAEYLEVAADGKSFRWKISGCFRVLIERDLGFPRKDLGGPSKDVATAWGTYVELRARAEWERRLYAPQNCDF